MTTEMTDFSWSREDWAPLTEMVDGFDEYRPAHSSALVGQRIELRGQLPGAPDSEHMLVHEFSTDSLHWTWQDGSSAKEGTESYELFEMQPGLFFLHYLRSGEDHPVVVSAALDLQTGQATWAVGELGLQPDPHLSRQQWFQGQVIGSDATPTGAHRRTDELLGHRIRYAYSSDDVYDHIYLNEHLFTWTCGGGAEIGLADTDRCTYWKLRDQTYLFSWLEKNVGVEGVVLIDLAALRTVGIQFGLDQQTGELINITMGAYAQMLGRAPGVDEIMPGPASMADRQEA